jgi:hypothetical protein
MRVCVEKNGTPKYFHQTKRSVIKRISNGIYVNTYKYMKIDKKRKTYLFLIDTVFRLKLIKELELIVLVIYMLIHQKTFYGWNKIVEERKRIKTTLQF